MKRAEYAHLPVVNNLNDALLAVIDDRRLSDEEYTMVWQDLIHAFLNGDMVPNLQAFLARRIPDDEDARASLWKYVEKICPDQDSRVAITIPVLFTLFSLNPPENVRENLWRYVARHMCDKWSQHITEISLANPRRRHPSVRLVKLFGYNPPEEIKANLCEHLTKNPQDLIDIYDIEDMLELASPDFDQFKRSLLPYIKDHLDHLIGDRFNLSLVELKNCPPDVQDEIKKSLLAYYSKDWSKFIQSYCDILNILGLDDELADFRNSFQSYFVSHRPEMNLICSIELLKSEAVNPPVPISPRIEERMLSFLGSLDEHQEKPSTLQASDAPFGFFSSTLEDEFARFERENGASGSNEGPK